MAAQFSFLLNGEKHQLPEGATVLDLVSSLGRDPRTVAVERNGELLPRAAYAATHLRAGDRLEVVHFVQGGCAQGIRKAGAPATWPLARDLLRRSGKSSEARECSQLSAGSLIEYDPGCKGR